MKGCCMNWKDGERQNQVVWACRVSRTCEITTLNNVIKVSPNILTLTDAASRGQKVGDSDFATLFHSVSRRPIHCSAMIAVNTRKPLRARNLFPHGPNLFALHFVRRRGIPRTSRCKKECSCPSIGKCTKSPRVADTA